MRITLIYRRFAIDNLLALLHQFYRKSPHTLHIGYENYLKSEVKFEFLQFWGMYNKVLIDKGHRKTNREF